MTSRSPLPTVYLARAVLNAANLSTPLGLLIGLLGRSHFRGCGRGLVLAEHGRLGPRRAAAFTVGNVIVVPRASMDELCSRNPGVLDHESAHAWQYAACLGLPFLPLYALASAWSWLRTSDVAAANLFETTAGLERGSYTVRDKDNSGFRTLARPLRHRN